VKHLSEERPKKNDKDYLSFIIEKLKIIEEKIYKFRR
jgi:hypothetical protein